MSLLRPLLRAPLLPSPALLAPARAYMDFAENERKGGYSRAPSKEDLQAMRREFFKFIPGEFRRLWNFLQESWFKKSVIAHRTFKTFEDFSRKPDYVRPEWVVTTDADHMEGYSEAKFERTEKGIGVFSGVLRTSIIQTGEQVRAGYVGIRSPANSVFGYNVGYDIRLYNCLVIRYRGDGRNYTINLKPVTDFDFEWHDLYSFNLYTKGGPYWQTAKIPLSKFMFNFKGRLQDHQFGIPDYSNLSCMIISLVDKKEGPFRLELESIGFYFDQSHKEKCAYEMYMVSSTSKMYK